MAETKQEALIRRPNPPKEGNLSEMGVLSPLGWATWMAERGVRPVEIPGEYWTAEGDGAVVACPCGCEPTVPRLVPASECPGEGCARWFFFTGLAVYVFNSVKDRAVEQVEEIDPDARL